ncbi:hypothetical protein GJ744_006768 [Endocarpon pusillum]|uniref:Uncharacterized protein n=1 Tax=Endocarpon pusillum TaxID=364733 RepID=A0A8H7DWQ5_9EURO|nr:hypothetical protein GJ744_006768 [Endocarpon pusillum]
MALNLSESLFERKYPKSSIMASVRIDSELMTNYVSAVPVPAGGHHVTVLDEKRMPMVFSLSNDKESPQLRIIRRDAQGRSEMFTIHKIIGLHDNVYIQYFHVEQSWSLKLHLVVACKSSDNSSSLVVLKPFLPDQLHEGAEPLNRISGESILGTIQKIQMSPISGSVSEVKFPDIFLLHKQLDQAASWGSDITHIHVDAQFKRWYATQELATPENVSQILDIAPAVSSYGQGLYVLYVVQGITKIYARFLRPDPHASDGTMYTFVTNVMCPKSARCIASILNDKGYTCLMIAAQDGIRYLTMGESTSKNQTGKLVLTADMHKGIRQLSVAQDRTAVTLWFRNQQGELGYTRTNSSDIAGAAVSSLLLPAGLSTAFAPVVTGPNDLTGQAVRQMVISNDKDGRLMLIEQSDDIGLWRKTPFYAPSKTTPTEVKSYTVSIKAFDDNKKPLSYGSVRLWASSALSVLLNGQNILLTKVPTWYDCDSTGSLDFIIPSDSLGAQAFRIESLRSKGGDILDINETQYDPSHKPMAKLAERLQSVENDDQFKRLQTETGENLFNDEIKKDQDTMAGARKCLGTISEAYSNVIPSHGPSAIMGPSMTSTTAHLVTTASHASENFGDMLMDAWFWVREKAHEVTEWIVNTTGSVWKFICKIGGEIKQFVLDTVEKICEAATWVWEKIKVGWQKLVDFIGFIFNWGDILTTKDTISQTITAGFGYAANKMDDLAVKVDGFFDRLERIIDQFGDSIKLDKQFSEGEGDRDKEIKASQTSTSSTWASERLKNGGAANDTKLESKGSTPSDQATDFWTTSVAPEITKLESEMSKLGTDITSLFSKSGSINANDVIGVSKSLLKVGLTAVRGIVNGLLKLVKVFITKICDIGNAEIDIPIFSWLYKKITRGHALTLFDAISLVVAIPTTIFSKLITGKAPPALKNMDARLMKSLVEGGDDVDDKVKTDWAVFRAEVAVGITLTSGAVGVIKLLYKMATLGLDEVLDELHTGPSSFFDVFGIAVDMIGCLMAIPDQADVPGADLRHWISGISLFRGAYHVLSFFVKGRGSFEKVVLGLDLLTILANLGLSIAVGIAEHKAGGTWKDYDEDATNTSFITSGLNALAGIAYFAAFAFKTSQPEISAVGACVMIGTMAGAAALEGTVLKIQYDALKRPTLVSPPAF